ncbi:MAG: hypothetical protein N3G18_08335 [Candidatus Saccharicenans sp.]|nr:hypothetical protein [Candidatus Saccharicenans sp.]
MTEKKKTVWLVLVIVLVLNLYPGVQTGARQPASEDGYALLDSLSLIFEAILTDREYLQKVNQMIAGLMVKARQLRHKNLIDKVFFARYHRLLGIIKVTLDPDPEKILTPVVDRVLTDFIHEVLAEDWMANRTENISLLATAIRDEIINLRLYLDDLEKKERLIKEWEQRYGRAR